MRRGGGAIAGVLVLLGALLALPALALVLLRLSPDWQRTVPTALAASFLPYGLALWLLALVLALLALAVARRHRGAEVLVLVAVAGLLLQGSWLGPDFVPDGRQARGQPLRVATANLRLGQADPAAVLRLVRGADLVSLEEVLPQTLTALDRRGLRRELPYRYGGTDPQHPSGTIILSRWPLTGRRRIPGTFQQYTAVAHVRGQAVRFAAVHPANPPYGVGPWLRDAHAVAQGVSTGDGPAVAAGDFNAIADHLTLRRLADRGWRDAVDSAGAGWEPTWPSPGSPVRGVSHPLLRIDHVLIADGVTARRVRTVVLPGSDHLGIRAVLRLPR